jgi:hypothetical protein
MTAFVSESTFISQHGGLAETFTVIERRILLREFQFHVIHEYLTTQFCVYVVPLYIDNTFVFSEVF